MTILYRISVILLVFIQFGFSNTHFEKSFDFECNEDQFDMFSCDAVNLTAFWGDEALNQNFSAQLGMTQYFIPDFTLTNDDKKYDFIRKDADGNCSFLIDSGEKVQRPYKFFNFTTNTDDNFSFTNFDGSSSIVIFDKLLFDSLDMCSAYIGGNVKVSNLNPEFSNFPDGINVNLEGCKEYLIGVSDFIPQNYQVEVKSQNALVHFNEMMESPEIYFAIWDENDLLVKIQDNSDFRNLYPGIYSVMPVNVEFSMELENELRGLNITQIENLGYCLQLRSIIAYLEILDVDQDEDGYLSLDDCDDNNANINPLMEEVANNDIDENCDGEVLIIDDDGDGFNSDEDCDDTNPNVYPGAIEIINNDVDEDCDGFAQSNDTDMDGFNSDVDCDDLNAHINPDAEEVANNDIDENCDGLLLIIDEDEDGFNSDEDCDDLNAAINPDAEEVANNDIDENCDGVFLVIDEDGDGFNSDDDCDDNNSNINPAAEEIVNNGIDENCDGVDLLSATDENNFKEINIYPNPMNEYLTIEFSQDLHSVEIYNVIGKIIYKNLRINSTIKLETAEWQEGMYIVKIKSLESESESLFKVMKI